jgi:hypothetical protein
MLLLARPAEPPSFAARTRELRDELQRQGPAMDFRSREVWQDFKEFFFAAQCGKCGYCEVFITGHAGAVEHYWPKGSVEELPDDATTWGRELESSTKVRGRKPRTVSKSGYWWLAYEWTNYLLACSVCNSSWKRSIFPVAENPRPGIEKDQRETPLLLNPFGPEDPVGHLSFDSLGQISTRSGSRPGFETIRTCGLDRPSLLLSRLEKARKAHFLVHRLQTMDGPELDEALADLRRMGQKEYHHAGMVRAIFEENVGMPWQKLEELVSLDGA